MLILHLLVPFPSSPLVIALFQACWAIPQFTVNACWQLFLSASPDAQSPLPSSHVPAGCCPVVQLSLWPLQPAIPNFDLPLPSAKAPIFVDTCNTHRKSAWWYLRTSALVSLEGKKQNWGVLVPVYMVLKAPLVCLPEKLLQEEISCSFSWEWKRTAIYS